MRPLLALDYESARWTEATVDVNADLFHSLEFLHLPAARFAQLPLAQRRKYSMAEAGNFFSVNIVGEHYGISTMKITPRTFFETHGLLSYRDRLLGEENSHTEVFKKIVSAMGHPAPTTAHLFGRPKPLDSIADALEFFGNIFVFEFVTTAVSAKIMADPRVEATTRSVHQYHWEDERHHLRQTRILLQALAKNLSTGDRKCSMEKATSWSGILARSFFPTQAIRQLEADSGQHLMDLAFDYSKRESPFGGLFESGLSLLQKAVLE